MNRTDIALKARAEMNKYGLTGWKVQFAPRAKKRAGQCDYRTRSIVLSPFILEQFPDERVINTILHEIAHALTPGHGHDEVWQAKAREIGCNASRLYDASGVTYDFKWSLVCQAGHVLGHYMRKSKADNTKACGLCPHHLKVRIKFITYRAHHVRGTLMKELAWTDFFETPQLRLVASPSVVESGPVVKSQNRPVQKTVTKLCLKHNITLSSQGLCDWCD